MTRIRTVAVVAVLVVALGSCSKGSGPSTGRVATAGTKGTLSSTSFQDFLDIPKQFTCDGADVSPALAWSVPLGTTSGLRYVLLVVDVDAPGGGFVHWLVYDLGDQGHIPEGGPVPGRQGTNSFGDVGWSGPCPPGGDDPHRYAFRLYAVEPSSLPDEADVEEVLGGIPTERPIAELTGTYARS